MPTRKVAEQRNARKRSLKDVKVKEVQLARAVRKAVGTAHVILTVVNFKEVLHTHKGIPNTPARMKMSPANALVRVENPKIVNSRLIINSKDGGGPVLIRFSIEDIAGKRDAYYPIGIAFVRKGKRESRIYTRTDIAARKTFLASQMHLLGGGRDLYVTDNYRYWNKHAKYEFYVIIQSAHNGKVGVIDPGIIHEN